MLKNGYIFKVNISGMLNRAWPLNSKTFLNQEINENKTVTVTMDLRKLGSLFSFFFSLFTLLLFPCFLVLLSTFFISQITWLAVNVNKRRTRHNDTRKKNILFE